MQIELKNNTLVPKSKSTMHWNFVMLKQHCICSDTKDQNDWWKTWFRDSVPSHTILGLGSANRQLQVKYFKRSKVDLSLTLLHYKFYVPCEKLLSCAWWVSSLLFKQSTSHSCVCSPTGLQVSGEGFRCFHRNGNTYVCTYMNRYFIMLANGTLLHFQVFSHKVIAISYYYKEKVLTRRSAIRVCSLHWKLPQTWEGRCLLFTTSLGHIMSKNIYPAESTKQNQEGKAWLC